MVLKHNKKRARDKQVKMSLVPKVLKYDLALKLSSISGFAAISDRTFLGGL
jgi:hypothetical protein